MPMAWGLAVDSGPYIVLSITDEGSGISAEHLARIFDPYFTTKATGNGLGLATSYSIIKAHHGHISVTSTVGQGTSFVIHLPATLKEAALHAETGDRMSTGTGGRILIMDDEEDVRSVAMRLLKRLGYASEAVCDGGAALARYSDARKAGQPFDVVMMDLTIPGGMGGIETIEQLRRIDPGVTAVVSSGYGDSAAMANFEQFGFQGVITKPFVPAEFQAIFERLTARPPSRIQ